MNTAPTTIQKLRALPLFYALNAGTTVFLLLTVFGPILPLYLSNLGLSKTQIGVVISIPAFFGIASLFFSKWIMRYGTKRGAILFYLLRTTVLILLVPSSWFAHRWGASPVFLWITGVILIFSIGRSLAETAFMAWSRELIPSQVRGKVDAITSITSGFMSILASLASAYIIARFESEGGFEILIAVGVFFGLTGAVLMMFCPGGAPAPSSARRHGFLEEILIPLRDRNYLWFIGGGSLFLLAAGMFSFVPLYITKVVGFSSGKVFLLDAVFRIGILCTSYLWGWSADRFGSKPLLMTGLLAMILFAPFLYIIPMFPHSAWFLSMAAWVWLGIAIQCYIAGSSRYFYVTAIPAGTTNSWYYSIHYAWAGLVSALASLLTGRLLDLCEPLHLQAVGLRIDAFTVVFTAFMMLLAGSVIVFHRLRPDGPIRTGEFISMFIQGNAILAWSSILRYRFAADEDARVSITRSLGETGNAFTVAELLEAVNDPSFNVRYEAIISIARMPPHEPLTQALIDIVRRKEPDLSVAAGWALGRIGDRRAVLALRQGLMSEYALLRSRCARSLANLDDTESAQPILAQFQVEKHDGIRVGYASALGVFQFAPALPDLLSLLRRLVDSHLQTETSLAIARMIGAEAVMIRLWKESRSDLATACAQTLYRIKAALASSAHPPVPLLQQVGRCAEDMALGEIRQAAQNLRGLIDAVPPIPSEPDIALVLKECHERLGEFGEARKDYILLAVSLCEAAADRLDWKAAQT